MLSSFDDVIDLRPAVPPDFRRMIIDILRVPERRGGFPFRGAEAQSRSRVRGGEINFAQRRKPDGEQITVGTFGKARAVIRPSEHRASRTIGNAYERFRSLEERHIGRMRHDARHGLTQVLRIERRRCCGQQHPFWKLALHDAKANAIASGVRHPRTAIGRTQETNERRMKSTAKHTAVAIRTT